MLLTQACLAAYATTSRAASVTSVDGRALGDEKQGANWLSVGRTYSENRFSPLAEINDGTVRRLRLAWHLDLPNEGALQGTPLAADGLLYFSGSRSGVYAVDGKTGHRLWEFDPDLSHHPQDTRSALYGGNHGLAYWRGKVYVGTVDGRLVALDARTGALVWSVNTFETPTMPKRITGAPRVCSGKVIIGFKGSGGARGYVSEYDAESGKKLWRFYTVPGDPSRGFENPQMAMAAKTWSGQWWKAGGNGSVWDGITCDPDFNRVYIGTADGGNAYEGSQALSPTGDMLFTSSIIALDADTGAYAWHLQINPHDDMEFDAASQMILAELPESGGTRKVLMVAPKNGFFYVVDRQTGKLLSAEKFEKATWAERIDLKTGRPVEAPHLRDGSTELEIWPTGVGAHSWQAMSFNPDTGLAYIPTMRMGWRSGPHPGSIDRSPQNPDEGTAGLVAWDPVAQRKRWEVRYADSLWNGGTLTTAGNLVFQGTGRGQFVVYNANTGEKLWSFNAGLGVIAAPMTYEAGGVQYVSILVGYGCFFQLNYGWHFNEQPRRLLTFALDARDSLPRTPAPRFDVHAVDDSSITIDEKEAASGAKVYQSHLCFECHGSELENFTSMSPDLRESRLALSWDAFHTVVHDGALAPLGMPKFQEIGDEDLRAVYMYIRQQAREATRSAH
ncbi:MAG: PQQ-binding-like beta-propeller repeat protein [Steroidobacteraceae bacterium]